jgi:hypothetical protein
MIQNIHRSRNVLVLALVSISVCALVAYGSTRVPSNTIIGTLLVNGNNWSWLVSNKTNELPSSHQVDVICRVTNVGRMSVKLSKPSFGPSAQFWYREAGKKDYSSGVPPGTFLQSPIVNLGTNEYCGDTIELSLPAGDYEILFKYLVDPAKSRWISSPVQHIHCN